MFAFLIRSSRPRFWIYLVGPYLLGLAAAGVPFRTPLNLTHIFFFVYFLFPANLLLYGVNDLADEDTDAHNPKKQGYEHTQSHTIHKRIVVFACLLQLALVCISPYIPTHTWLPLGGFLGLSLAYSLPPLRLKARPFFDAASNLLYAMPGFVAYYVSGFTHASLLVLFASACWCAAMHAWSAVPDIDADTRAGLRTIATTLGAERTIITCGWLFALSGICAWPWLGPIGVCCAVIYVSLMWKARTLSDEERFGLYKRFPRINALIGIAMTFYVLSLQLH